MSRLLIATRNQGKLSEFRRLLGELPVELLCLSDLGIAVDIDETGRTFAENAKLKASGYSLLAGVPTLADDSGIEIDQLNGRPGVRSARYAGESANDSERVDKVLFEMSDAAASIRSARFVCVLAFSDATGAVLTNVEGICEGAIADAPRGIYGFGYDPIFCPNGFDKTFAELDDESKNRISHRARAALKLMPFLRGFFDI